LLNAIKQQCVPPRAEVHNPTWFDKNSSKTFRMKLLTGKEMKEWRPLTDCN